MKKYDILKISYYEIFALFFSIVSSTIFTLFHIKAPTIPLLFGISSICILIFYFLINKGAKPWLSILITEIIAVIEFSFITFIGEIIWGSLLVFIILIYVCKKWNVDVNYGMITFHIKRFFKILVVLGLYVSMLCYADVFTRDVNNMFRMYIAFFLLSVLVVREARIYTYKIKSKKNMVVDALLIASILILSIKELMIFFANLFLYIWNAIYSVIFSCIAFLANVLYIYIIKTFMDKLRSFWYHSLKNQQGNTENLSDYHNGLVEQLDKIRGKNKVFHMSNTTEIVLAIIISVIIAIVIIKLIKKHNSKSFNSGNYITEKREKIIDETDEYKSPKKPFIKRIISVFNKDERSKILLLYKYFLKLSYLKGFFRRHMTPTQLKNTMEKEKYDETSLKVITEVYNEAKFSDHEIGEKTPELMKEKINNINKELKRRD